MEFLNLYKDASVQRLLMQMQQAGQLNHIQVQPGICIRHGCNNYVSHEQRFPQGRASRALCPSDWNQAMALDRYVCVECGGRNPDEQAWAVMNNPREIFNRLCSDECKAKWAYRCHLAAGGAPLALPQGRHQQGFIAPGTVNVPLPAQQRVPQPSIPQAQYPPHQEPQQIVVNNTYNYTVHVHSDGSRNQARGYGHGNYEDDIIDAQVIRSEPLSLPEPEEGITIDQMFSRQRQYAHSEDEWD